MKGSKKQIQYAKDLVENKVNELKSKKEKIGFLRTGEEQFLDFAEDIDQYPAAKVIGLMKIFDNTQYMVDVGHSSWEEELNKQ